MSSNDRHFHAAVAAATLASLGWILAWDTLGFDLSVASWTAAAGGFPLRDHWLFSRVLHDGLRGMAGLMLLWPVVAWFRPAGVLRLLPRAGILWLAGTVVTGMLLVSLLKHGSLTSCPWDLRQFGGTARQVSHWAWGLADGGPGHCFPGGHASAGFAWVAGFFAFRRIAPDVARTWLAVALAAGLLMGLAQQVRGAHFTSHTLWTAWLCWTWAWTCSWFLPEGAHARAAGRG